MPTKLPLLLDPNAPDESKAGKAQEALQAMWEAAKNKTKPVADAVNAGVESLSNSPAGKLFNSANDARSQFINNAANQMNFTKNTVTPQGDLQGVENAKNVMDMALPSPADALLLGGGKMAGFLGKHAPELASKIAKAHGEFMQVNPLLSEVGAVGKQVPQTAAHALEAAKDTGFGKLAMAPMTQQEKILADMKQRGQARLAAKLAAEKKP
jgi:hypothetical protein